MMISLCRRRRQLNFDLLLCANCVVYDTYQWNADRRVMAEKKSLKNRFTTKRSNRGNGYGEKQPVKLSWVLVCVCRVCDKQRNITEILVEGIRCHRSRRKNRRAIANGKCRDERWWFLICDAFERSSCMFTFATLSHTHIHTSLSFAAIADTAGTEKVDCISVSGWVRVRAIFLRQT